MEYYHNPGKDLVITVEGRRYLRHGIRTHFVGVGEDYLSLFRRYVAPVYQPGGLCGGERKGSCPLPGPGGAPGGGSGDPFGPTPGPVRPPDPWAGDGPAGKDAVCPRPGGGGARFCGPPSGLGWTNFGDPRHLLPPAGAGGPGAGRVLRGGHPRLCGLRDPHPPSARPAVRPGLPGDGDPQLHCGRQCPGSGAAGKGSGPAPRGGWLTAVLRDNPAGQEGQCTPFLLIRPAGEIGAG